MPKSIYLRARHYNPSSGRFTQRDSHPGKNEDPLSLNKYTYCQNNPLIYVDPSGLYSVVIYASYPDEKGETKVNKKQAKVIKKEYEEKYDSECYVYKVGTAEEFVETWNNLDDSEGIDAIQFIGHGTAEKKTDRINYGYGNIFFGDGSKLYAESYNQNIAGEINDRKRRIKGINDYNIDEVQSKNVGSIYFSACNTANLDFKANIAQAFYDKNPDSEVTGWDGGVFFQFKKKKIFKVNKDVSVDWNSQTTFRSFMEKSGNIRKPGPITLGRGGKSGKF